MRCQIISSFTEALESSLLFTQLLLIQWSNCFLPASVVVGTNVNTVCTVSITKQNKKNKQYVHILYVEINLCTTSFGSRVFLWVVEILFCIFFLSASVGKANSAQLCMVPRLHIRWRSAWITCDFPRLWSCSPASPQTILICRLSSESPITTSVDRSNLLPSKSKWVQGQLEYGTEDENSYQPTTPSYSAVVSEWRSLAHVVIRLIWDSGGKLWCICHCEKLISWDNANERKGQPWHAWLV